MLTSRLALGMVVMRMRPGWMILCPWTLVTVALGASRSGGGPDAELCLRLEICCGDTEMD